MRIKSHRPAPHHNGSVHRGHGMKRRTPRFVGRRVLLFRIEDEDEDKWPQRTQKATKNKTQVCSTTRLSEHTLFVPFRVSRGYSSLLLFFVPLTPRIIHHARQFQFISVHSGHGMKRHRSPFVGPRLILLRMEDEDDWPQRTQKATKNKRRVLSTLELNEHTLLCLLVFFVATLLFVFSSSRSRLAKESPCAKKSE
jgi:hypothetical protein